MKKILTAITFAAIVLTGCNKNEFSDSALTGGLKLTVSQSSNLTVKSSEDVDLDSFTITFTKPTDDTYSLSYTVADFKSTFEDGYIAMSPGSYTVTVISPYTKNAAWDQPIYGGSEDFVIASETVTAVEVVCTIQNMKVTVELSDVFTREFSDYNIVVTGEYDGANESLTYDSARITAGEAGWFAVSALQVDIRAIRSSGAEVNQTGYITNVNAADHHIISINTTGTGDASLTISIDDTVNDNTVDITVPGFDEVEIPDEDSSDDSDDSDDSGDDSGDSDDDSGDSGDSGDTGGSSENAPTLVWEDNQTFESKTITDDLTVELIVSVPNGIKTFKVGIESDELSESLVSIGTFSGLDLTNNPYDLINDQDAVTFFGNLELPVGEELSNHTSVDFVLTELLKMIPAVASSGTSHTFVLYVTDNEDLSLEQSLTFIVE